MPQQSRFLDGCFELLIESKSVEDDTSESMADPEGEESCEGLSRDRRERVDERPLCDLNILNPCRRFIVSDVTMILTTI
jgi:hypothetical protein